MISLVAFLGNPGSEYRRTRHNFGRMLSGHLPEAETIHWREKFHGRVGEYGSGSGRCRVLVPETFMNLSGKSLAAAANFHKVQSDSLLVVHDELELPFGVYAWRRGGGMGGHNGLKSIRDALGTSNFLRLRLGIGRPVQGSVQSWVLGRFLPEEEAVLNLILDAAARDLDSRLRSGRTVQDREEPVRVYTSD